MSTLLFTITVVIAVLLLVIAAIATATGAVECFSSRYYNLEQKVRGAHSNLTTASVLGWTSVGIMIMMIIIAVVAGGFDTTEVSDALLSSKSISSEDMIKLIKGKAELQHGQTSSIILLIVLIIVSIIVFAMGILSTIAAVQLSNPTPGQTSDPKLSTAYTAAIIGAVSGVGGIIFMIIALVTYVAVRSYRERELSKINQVIELNKK